MRVRWRTVLVALGLVGAAAATPAVEPHRPASPDSAAGRALLAQPLGPDPAGAWSWLRAWGQVFPDDRDGYRLLRRGLVDLYLRQAAGEPVAADATLATLREAGAALPPLEQDRDAHARWSRALQQGLAPLRAAAGPLPGEIEALADRLQPLAPGLWLTRHADGRPRNLVWAQRVSVRGLVPLAPQALEAHVGAPSGSTLLFDCPPERGQPRAVRPGDTWQLLCRSRGEVDERSPALRAMLASLSRDGVAAAAWVSTELMRQTNLEPMIDALMAALPDRTASYAAAHRPCELRGRCAQESAAGTRVRPRAGLQAASGSQRALPPEPELASAPSARQWAQGAALTVAAFIVFCLVARTAGDRVAAVLMLVLLLPLAWRFGSGFGAASVLLAGGALAAALLATGVFLVGYWLYDATVFSRFAPRRAGRGRRRRASA